MKITDVSSSSTSETRNSDHENEKDTSESGNRRRKQTLLEKFEIPVEQLDFAYVNKCSDPLKIERILRVLRSAEEGIYPDLENCVVAKLEELKPSSRLLRVETPALRTKELGSDQKKDIENGLDEWLSAVGEKGRMGPETIFDPGAHDAFPLPVRGSSEQKVNELKSSKFTNLNKPEPNKDRIKSWEYDKWDKFDVDAELTKFDVRDMQMAEWEKREKPNVIAEQKQIEKLMRDDGGGGDCSGLSSTSSKPTQDLIKPKAKRSARTSQTKKPISLGKSYIEEVDNEDDEDGVQVTAPNNSNPRRTKVVIEDLNLRM